MSIFSVPVTIGIDEEKIAQEIESNVEAKVVSKITKEVEEIIYNKRSYYCHDKLEPLKAMVISEVKKCIEVNEKEIINAAAKSLADKMARSKVYREAIKDVVENSKEY